MRANTQTLNLNLLACGVAVSLRPVLAAMRQHWKANKSMKAQELIAQRGISEKLAKAVIRQIGGQTAFEDHAEDIQNHGADSGFAGFTYYSDTVAFAKRNRVLITDLVERMADDLGETPVDMVAGFQCLAGRDCRGKSDHERRTALQEYIPSVCRCLYGGRLTEDDTQVANALAWFALEECARAYCDAKDEVRAA